MRLRLLVVLIPLFGLLGACKRHGGSPDGSANDLGVGSDGGGVDLGPTVDLGPAGALTFESGPVRPVALSADGTRLIAARIDFRH